MKVASSVVWCWDEIWCLEVVASVEMDGFVRCERPLWMEVRINRRDGLLSLDVINERWK